MSVLYDRFHYRRHFVNGIDRGLPNASYDIDPPVHIASIAENLSVSTQEVRFGNVARLPWSAGWLYIFEATKILRQLLGAGLGMNDAIVAWVTEDETIPGKVPLVKIAVCLLNFDVSDEGVPNDQPPPWDMMPPIPIPEPPVIPKSQWERLIDD